MQLTNLETYTSLYQQPIHYKETRVQKNYPPHLGCHSKCHIIPPHMSKKIFEYLNEQETGIPRPSIEFRS